MKVLIFVLFIFLSPHQKRKPKENVVGILDTKIFIIYCVFLDMFPAFNPLGTENYLIMGLAN